LLTRHQDGKRFVVRADENLRKNSYPKLRPAISVEEIEETLPDREGSIRRTESSKRIVRSKNAEQFTIAEGQAGTLW
jgi:hypothetical protein